MHCIYIYALFIYIRVYIYIYLYLYICTHAHTHVYFYIHFCMVCWYMCGFWFSLCMIGWSWFGSKYHCLLGILQQVAYNDAIPKFPRGEGAGVVSRKVYLLGQDGPYSNNSCSVHDHRAYCIYCTIFFWQLKLLLMEQFWLSMMGLWVPQTVGQIFADTNARRPYSVRSRSQVQ